MSFKGKRRLYPIPRQKKRSLVALLSFQERPSLASLNFDQVIRRSAFASAEWRGAVEALRSAQASYEWSYEVIRPSLSETAWGLELVREPFSSVEFKQSLKSQTVTPLAFQQLLFRKSLVSFDWLFSGRRRNALSPTDWTAEPYITSFTLTYDIEQVFSEPFLLAYEILDKDLGELSSLVLDWNVEDNITRIPLTISFEVLEPSLPTGFAGSVQKPSQEVS